MRIKGLLPGSGAGHSSGSFVPGLGEPNGRSASPAESEDQELR